MIWRYHSSNILKVLTTLLWPHHSRWYTITPFQSRTLGKLTPVSTRHSLSANAQISGNKEACLRSKLVWHPKKEGNWVWNLFKVESWNLNGIDRFIHLSMLTFSCHTVSPWIQHRLCEQVAWSQFLGWADREQGGDEGIPRDCSGEGKTVHFGLMGSIQSKHLSALWCSSPSKLAPVWG